MNRVRIIGGTWRSRVISFPPAAELRPTPDRVRETLFNWLGQDLTGKSCLDLYAGSGVLGFEALSRGAAQVVMVERDRRAVPALRDNAARLGASNLEVVAMDALQFLRSDRRVFDVVFLDPPYRSGVLPDILREMDRHLAPEGRVYAECGEALELPPGWMAVRKGRAGAAHYHLLAQGPPCP
ncbi:MAG TPA: 16S rRNA (guanine(966)-N(2))-methyltransferase RsmD [Burkholderiales bacterium]